MEPPFAPTPWSRAEMMVVAAARELSGRRVCFVGVGLPNAAANLAMTDITLPSPVFAGDTLWAESEILDKRDSKSNPDVGIVSMRCRGINQRQQVVIEYRRTFMLYKRTAPQAKRSFPGTDEEWRT